jgi:hypothetical protein
VASRAGFPGRATPRLPSLAQQREVIPLLILLATQGINGALVDRVSQGPIGVARVAALDAQGQVVAEVLSDRVGAFTVLLPTAGTYQLRIRRVGFKPFTSPFLDVQTNEMRKYRLEIDPIPVDLIPVVVEGERKCDLTEGRSGPALAALWTEVSEALHAVSLSSSDSGYLFEIELFERDYTRTDDIYRDSSRITAGRARKPFQSPPADYLRSRGFISADSTGWVYSAPDAEVLLSDQFLKTHCFDTRIGEGDTQGLFGLGFSPSKKGGASDVRGVLWVDRGSAELRSLEFAFTDPPRARSTYVRGRRITAGGSMSFRRLPSGEWIVQTWSMQMPHAAIQRNVIYRRTGGSVLRISDRTGTAIYARALATVLGAVIDSTTGHGLADARVFFSGTPYSARSDSTGLFRLSVPVSGTHRLMFSHPRLDSVAFIPTSVSIGLRPDTTVVVTLFVPSERGLIARLCGEQPMPLDKRVVAGVVREGSSKRGVAQASVIVAWTETTQLPGAPKQDSRSFTVRTNDLGWYVACAVPLGPTLTVSLQSGGLPSSVTVTIDPSVVVRLLRKDLEKP